MTWTISALFALLVGTAPLPDPLFDPVATGRCYDVLQTESWSLEARVQLRRELARLCHAPLDDGDRFCTVGRVRETTHTYKGWPNKPPRDDDPRWTWTGLRLVGHITENLVVPARTTPPPLGIHIIACGVKVPLTIGPWTLSSWMRVDTWRSVIAPREFGTTIAHYEAMPADLACLRGQLGLEENTTRFIFYNDGTLPEEFLVLDDGSRIYTDLGWDNLSYQWPEGRALLGKSVEVCGIKTQRPVKAQASLGGLTWTQRYEQVKWQWSAPRPTIASVLWLHETGTP